MHPARARFVTTCQQLLVTAVVVTVGLSAAGVVNLEIVAPSTQGDVLSPAVRVQDAFVDTAPVRPRVREVAARGIDRAAQRRLPHTGTNAPQDQAPAEVRLAPSPSAEASPTTSAAPSASPAQPRTSTTPEPRTLAVLTAPEKVTGYATVGVTWDKGDRVAEDNIDVAVRTRTDGAWSRWTTVPYHDDHGPDAGTTEGASVRAGTDALVVGDVNAAQMRVETTDGSAPRDVKLALIDPGAGPMARQQPAIDTSEQAAASTDGVPSPSPSAAPTSSADTAALQAMTPSAKPVIFSRAQWGANERVRDQSAPSYGTVQTGFVHHTVNANEYTADQVPALIRGIYAYHVESLGWRDIGYNYLVDRFGRIWEGRYGGVTRAVVGAHTRGFNEVSFAMSAIGNYDTAAPPQAVVNAYSRLFAWKLSLYDINAAATRLLVKGTSLHGINGHRDVGQTACPGRYLYARLGDIRSGARGIQLAAQTAAPPAPTPTTAPPTTPPPTTPPVTDGVPTIPLTAGAPINQPAGMVFPARTSLAGDPWPDLVLRDAAGKVTVQPTGGQAGYDLRTTSVGPWGGMKRVVAVGDVTGDKRGDVLAQSRATGETRIHAGDGAGHVAATGTRPSRDFTAMNLVLGAGDFDGNGTNDVIARLGSTSALYLFRGDGTGGFTRRLRIAETWPFARTTVAGDLDGDKRPDLAGLSLGGTLSAVHGNGAAGLGTRTTLAQVGTRVNALVGGDSTGDGVGDVLVRVANTSYWLPGTGTNGLGHRMGPFTRLAGLTRLSAGPMNGTAAHQDVVGVNASGSLVVLRNSGGSNLTAPTPSNLTVPGSTQVLDVGDWNKDGRGDLITREDAGDRLVLRLGLGDGRFARGRVMADGWSGVTQLAAVGDVTGDKRVDLVGRRGSGRVVVFRGNGAFGFFTPVLAAAATRTYNQIGTSGVWATGLMPSSAFLSADGSFVPSTSSDARSLLRVRGVGSPELYDFVVGVGDANDDDMPDLMARQRSTGDLWLLPGQASGGVGTRRYVGSGFGGYRLLG